jgi:hypothetical protein
MQELILRNASEEEFLKAARKNGFVSLHEDAIIKMLKHEIPYEEMNAFRSQVADAYDDEEPVETTNVDNSEAMVDPEAIIESDENTLG